MRIYKRLKNSIDLEELVKVLGSNRVMEFICNNADSMTQKTLLVPLKEDMSRYLYLNENSISILLDIEKEEASSLLEELYVHPVSMINETVIIDRLRKYVSKEEVAVTVDIDKAFSNVFVDATCNKLLYYQSNIMSMDIITEKFGQEVLPLIGDNTVLKRDLWKFREANKNIKEFKVLLEMDERYIVLDSELIHNVTKIDKFRIILTMHSISQKLRQGRKYTDLFKILMEELKNQHV